MRPSATILNCISGAMVALIIGGCDQDTDKSSAESPITESPITLFPAIGSSGSMAPNLARGPDGSVVLSWIEPDGDGHALNFVMQGQGDWQRQKRVARGDNWFVNWADFPSVVPLSNDLWGAHWLERQPAGGYAYDVKFSISHDAGNSWSDPVLGHTDNTETEHGFVSLFPSGPGIGFVYLDGRKQANEFTEDPNDTGMTLRAGLFSPEGILGNEQLVDNLICDCCQTDVALAADGPVAVYRNRTEAEIRDIYVTRQTDGRWSAGTAIHDDGWEIPGCPVNGPEIAANGQDVAVAWFTGANDQPVIRFVRSDDSGRTFSQPIDVETGDVLGHVGMTLDADGNAWLIWQDRAGDGMAELSMRRVSARNVLGEKRTVTAKGGLAAFSVPQIVATESTLVFAWTEGEYGETNVISAEMALPPGK